MYQVATRKKSRSFQCCGCLKKCAAEELEYVNEFYSIFICLDCWDLSDDGQRLVNFPNRSSR